MVNTIAGVAAAAAFLDIAGPLPRLGITHVARRLKTVKTNDCPTDIHGWTRTVLTGGDSLVAQVHSRRE